MNIRDGRFLLAQHHEVRWAEEEFKLIHSAFRAYSERIQVAYIDVPVSGDVRWEMENVRSQKSDY